MGRRSQSSIMSSEVAHSLSLQHCVEKSRILAVGLTHKIPPGKLFKTYRSHAKMYGPPPKYLLDSQPLYLEGGSGLKNVTEKLTTLSKDSVKDK